MTAGTLTVRPATRAEAEALAALINPIIARGGTTAHEEPMTPAYYEKIIDGLGPRDFFHVAEAEGRILGFQYVEAHDGLDPDTGDIATFVALDAARGGVGGALADRTILEARARGWRRLHAYIRADNEGGLAYYERIGFRTDRIDPAVPLKDGTPVDRVSKLMKL